MKQALLPNEATELLTAPYTTSKTNETFVYRTFTNETFVYTSPLNALNGLISKGDTLFVQCKNELEENKPYICLMENGQMLIGLYLRNNILITDDGARILGNGWKVCQIVEVQKLL